MSALRDDRPAPPDTPRGVEPVPRRGDNGEWTYRFRTRWKDPVTHKQIPSPVYDTVEEVLAFRVMQGVGRDRSRGDVVKLTRNTITLKEFAEVEYWPRWAPKKHQPSTIRSNRSVYRNHLLPHLGHVQLRRLDPGMVEDLLDELVEDGVSAHMAGRALVILRGICNRAIVAGIVDLNPTRAVRRPRLPKRGKRYTPGAEAIEAVLHELAGDPMSVALVALLGYEGLRPSEALGIEDQHILERTLLIEQRVIDGQLLLGLKNSGDREDHSRSPDLYAAVRQDLARHLEHRRPAGRRARHQLVFPGAGGRPWTAYDYRRWRETVFAPAVRRAGVPIERPYALRHGCASMLLHAGRPLAEIAQHMGHTVTTLDRYYTHLIAELRGGKPVDVEQQIAAARQHQTQGDTMRQSP